MKNKIKSKQNSKINENYASLKEYNLFILSENPFTSLLTDSLRKGALLQSKSRSSISQIDFLMSNPMKEKSKIKEQLISSQKKESSQKIDVPFENDYSAIKVPSTAKNDINLNIDENTNKNINDHEFSKFIDFDIGENNNNYNVYNQETPHKSSQPYQTPNKKDLKILKPKTIKKKTILKLGSKHFIRDEDLTLELIKNFHKWEKVHESKDIHKLNADFYLELKKELAIENQIAESIKRCTNIIVDPQIKVDQTFLYFNEANGGTSSMYSYHRNDGSVSMDKSASIMSNLSVKEIFQDTNKKIINKTANVIDFNGVIEEEESNLPISTFNMVSNLDNNIDFGNNLNNNSMEQIHEEEEEKKDDNVIEEVFSELLRGIKPKHVINVPELAKESYNQLNINNIDLTEKTAKIFYSLLFLSQKHNIDVTQEIPFGDIIKNN